MVISCYDASMREHEIEADIRARNALRRSAGLPALGDEERHRLRSARAKRVMEAAYAVERVRFDPWIKQGDGFWAKAGRWSLARRQLASELKLGMHTHQVLIQFGYRLADDAWAESGRRTYLFDEAADRALLQDLGVVLAEYGWAKHPTVLRAFTNTNTGELLEVEIGGPDTSGHFVHHLKSE